MFNYRKAEKEEIPYGSLAEALDVSTLYHQHENLRWNVRTMCRRLLGGILATSSVLAIWQGKHVLCCKAVFVSSQRLGGISLRGNYKKHEIQTNKEFLELSKNETKTTCPAQQVSGKEISMVAKVTAFFSREKVALSSCLLGNSNFNQQLIVGSKSVISAEVRVKH